MEIDNHSRSISLLGRTNVDRDKIAADMTEWAYEFENKGSGPFSTDLMLYHKSGVLFGDRSAKEVGPISLFSYKEETDPLYMDPFHMETIEWVRLGAPEKFNCTLFDLLHLPPHEKRLYKSALKEIHAREAEDLEKMRNEKGNSGFSGVLNGLNPFIGKK